MIYTYHPDTQRKEILIDNLNSSALWYDLLNPTSDEIKAVEKALNIEIPNQEEMREIEFSSRCYVEQDTTYMTINVIVSTESDVPESLPITFILNERNFVTLRYSEPKSITLFIKKLEKNHKNYKNPHALFLNLLEVIVDRVADIIETIGEKIDKVSRDIFDQSNQSRLRDFLVELGKEGDLSAKVRLTLENLNRLFKFFTSEGLTNSMTLDTLKRDVTSISEHLSFIFNKINFLLDATLGLISIEQNNVVKILSVAAVIFLPPTLIASIYGMNFAFIPELNFAAGYPLALLLMILTAIVPYFYFKRKGWFR